MRVLESGGCAACYQFTNKRLVDMSAAFDGPVLENGMTIDDLILCEDCVRSAVQVLELDSQRDVVDRALLEAREAREKAEEWQRYARKLENVKELRPVDDLPKVKKTGKAAA